MKQLGNLDEMMLVRGPLCGLFIAFLALLRAIGRANIDFLEGLWFVSVMYVMGMMAGLISSLLWPDPETEEKAHWGGIWDLELDGPM